MPINVITAARVAEPSAFFLSRSSFATVTIIVVFVTPVRAGVHNGWNELWWSL